MKTKITTINSKQRFAANFITATVIYIGSKYQLPVSTTHVSVGTLFGIGLQGKSAKWTTIIYILIAWIITLPAWPYLDM
jgi:PiT family inorganic phosphate transporter